MKTDLFQSCGHCWVFQICWHIEFITFTASSFRIWNSSTGITSPPLALFLVMLPKAHLTSHSRVSGSRWVIIPSWLNGLWRSFSKSSSVYSCHLYSISYASVRSIPFLSFIEPIFAWNIPLVSLIFLKRSLVFPILLFSSISLQWSLRKAFLSLLAILWNSAFKQVYLFLFSFTFHFSSFLTLYNVYTDINGQTRDLMASIKSLVMNQVLQYKLTSIRGMCKFPSSVSPQQKFEAVDQYYSSVTAQFYLASKGKYILEAWVRANPRDRNAERQSSKRIVRRDEKASSVMNAKK